jgi:hypothetical protein
MTKRKSKYSGVLAKPIRLFDENRGSIGMLSRLTPEEARRHNYAEIEARVHALRRHYGLGEHQSDWVLVIRMGRDLGIPGCQEEPFGKKRKDAVDLKDRIELVATVDMLVDSGATHAAAFRKIAKHLWPKAAPNEREKKVATLKTRYYETRRKLGPEAVEGLKRAWF